MDARNLQETGLCNQSGDNHCICYADRNCSIQLLYGPSGCCKYASRPCLPSLGATRIDEASVQDRLSVCAAVIPTRGMVVGRRIALARPHPRIVVFNDDAQLPEALSLPHSGVLFAYLGWNTLEQFERTNENFRILNRSI